jgi:hypothetical protein
MAGAGQRISVEGRIGRPAMMGVAFVRTVVAGKRRSPEQDL